MTSEVFATLVATLYTPLYWKDHQVDVPEELGTLITGEPTAAYADRAICQNIGGLSYICDETLRLYIAMDVNRFLISYLSS